VIAVGVFFLSATIVVLAATALAKFADELAEATNIGRVWMGSILLASATSLPELVTDISAVRLGAADLAVGDLFGSSMANMLILSIIDLVPPRGRVLGRATFDHALAATLAISLNAIAAVLVIVRARVSFLGVGPGSVILFLGYIAGARVVFRHVTGKRDDAAPDSEKAAHGTARAKGFWRRLRRPIVGFALSAVVILISAPALAWSAKGIATMSGLSNTFVGTWLVGLATSLPELVASLAAVRMGAFDLAVGNLFGSNALNMAIFLPLDLAQPGNLFAALDPNHALSALSAIVLMSIGLAAIVFRAKHRVAVIEPDSVLMLLAYVAALWMVYRHVAGVAAGG
jgi:cation:H+ antiporter